jgi:hypothetical protein
MVLINNYRHNTFYYLNDLAPLSVHSNTKSDYVSALLKLFNIRFSVILHHLVIVSKSTFGAWCWARYWQALNFICYALLGLTSTFCSRCALLLKVRRPLQKYTRAGEGAIRSR